MTRIKKRRWRKLIVLLAALTCAGTWAAGQVRSLRDRSEVAKMTENMKTICVGRFLVNVPEHSEVALSRERIAGFEITTTEESEDAFLARLKKRENEIDTRAHSDNDEGGLVDAHDLRITGMIGRAFVYGRSRGYLMEGDRRVDMESVSIEVHAHKSGVSFSLASKESSAERVRVAETLLSRLRLLNRHEIPREQGFCIQHAVFADPLPPHKTEHIAMHIGFVEHPDVALAFASMPGGNSSQDLLTRYAEMDAEASPDELIRVAKLRQSARNINGFAGHEVLERVHEFNFTTTYGFVWETRGAMDDVFKPFLSLELHGGVSPRAGGKPVDASLHEDALLALWDGIASSIRLRPAGPSSKPAEPPIPTQPPRGTSAFAGDTCPRSGWWQCCEHMPGCTVQGGSLRWLRQGDYMPHALLLQRQTLWQKLRGIQPSIEPERRTAWQLADTRQRPRMPASVALAEPGLPTNGTVVDTTARVGARARTGECCPVDGWWRCDDALALDGTRWFACGSVLPTATFHVVDGLFARAGAGTIQRRTDWQLVRHASAREG